LHLRSRFGVTITRITRHDLEFVPDAGQTIQFGDALTAIGEPEGLDAFVAFAGHRERSFDETDIISLALGMLLGVLLGRVQVRLGDEIFSLGMAGGPLVVGLILGHFGRIGPIVGHFPRAARLLLTEIGLAMFLATAGVSAGSQLVPVIREHGPGLCVGAVLITIIPLAVGLLLTRYAIRMGLLRSLGGICGAMTSTPGLGALTSKIDSNVPVTSYATVYPIALVLMSLLAPILVSVMS
jgi:putative transport protein